MRACDGFPDLRRALVFLLEFPEDALVFDGAADEGVKGQPPKKKGSGEDVGLDVPV